MNLLELIDTYWLYFLVGQYPDGPLGGIVLTIQLSAIALIISIPLGMLFGLARVSPIKSIRYPITIIVYVIRSTPLLMVIFWSYFFLPQITHVKTDQFYTMLIALVIFDSAYLAEIFKAGIFGIAKGQYEAARSLGLGYMQTMLLVIIPQAVRNMLPSLVNQFVSTVKESSLGYIIGLAEVSFVASQINNLVFTMPVEVYTILGLSYFLICFALSKGAYYLERHLNNKNQHIATA